MQEAARFFGTLLGYTIGYALKIAGPELRVFLIGVIRDAFKDTVEVGAPNAALDAAWSNGVRNSNEDKARTAGNGPEWDLSGKQKDGVP